MSKSVYILCPIIACSGAAIAYAAWLYKEIKKYEEIPGPKPRGLLGFLFGNLPLLNERMSNGISFAEQVYRDFEEFNCKIMKYRIFSNTIVIIRDPKIIKTVLIDQSCSKDKEFFRRIGFPYNERLIGNGLLTEIDNNKWKNDRSLFNPGFHREALKSFMKEFNAKVDILMQNLRTAAESKNNKISLLEKFNKTALDVIASVAFSMEIDSINDPENQFNLHIFNALEGIQSSLINPFAVYNPLKREEISNCQKSIRFIREIGRKQIVSRIEAMKNELPLPQDILTTILKSHEDEIFSIETMVDQFVTFFLAGQETTANTLASAFLEIGRRPDILQKLRDEIDTEIGSKVFIDYDDLSKLKYTGCIFKEALRLYPAAASVRRKCDQEIIADGVIIPKGSLISLQMYSTGRTAEYFPDPLSFKPERFLPENAENIKPYTYFPFSLGPRNCIGQNFAQIEAKVIIAKFIQNFDFITDPTQSFDMSQTFTLRPKDGTKGQILIRK